MRGWRDWAVWTVVAVVGCAAHPAGLRYQVAQGENLYRIGKAYGIDYQELARVNHIANPDRIEVGRVLVIPHATRRVPVGMITPERAQSDRPTPAELPSGLTPFVWPIPGGSISSEFGMRGTSHHDGIDIPCHDGVPVHAARAGRILYSDQLRGYGNLVIMEHDEGYATVYAHLRQTIVPVGSAVRQGEPIATCGDTGKTSGPNLHFEVRKANVARNPLFYLPPSAVGGPVPRGTAVVERGA